MTDAETPETPKTVDPSWKPDSDALIAAELRIAELERKLSAAQAPAEVSDSSGTPKDPTHLQVLACGCTQPVRVPAATQSYCATDEAHGLQPVSTYHELAAEPVA